MEAGNCDDSANLDNEFWLQQGVGNDPNQTGNQIRDPKLVNC